MPRSGPRFCVCYSQRMSWPRYLTTAVLLAAATATLAAQQPTFKAGTQLVPVFVTVTDAEKRLVPDLVKEDFDVLDNGKPTSVVLFDSEVQPITVVVMLDTSGSMTGSLDLLRSAAEQFVIRLLPADKGLVGAFNDKIQFAGTFTSNRDDLVGSLRDLDYGNPTRLFDAIDASLDQLRGKEGRRAILVFTDGEDTFSKASMGRVLDRARTEEVMIYSIGLESNVVIGSQRIRTRPDRGLRKLSDETGGGYFELKRTDELGPTFTRVALELHSQYSLAFTPATDGRVHKLDVVVKKPGMNTRARKSYQAPTAQTQ
jgi:Ca-activated chloride channel homolog